MSQITNDVDAHMENTSPITVPHDPLAAFGSDMASPPASQSAADVPLAANSQATRGNPAGQRQAQVQTHGPSGYTYIRDEDAPGWLWKNKRAQEEMQRALRDVEAKNTVVGVRYGDPALVANADTPWDKII